MYIIKKKCRKRKRKEKAKRKEKGWPMTKGIYKQNKMMCRRKELKNKKTKKKMCGKRVISV